MNVKYVLLTSVAMKTIFWDVTPGSQVEDSGKRTDSTGVGL
jgi:hypothetical protein